MSRTTTAATCWSIQDLAMSTRNERSFPGLVSSSSDDPPQPPKPPSSPPSSSPSSSSEDLTDLVSRMATTDLASSSSSALPKPKPMAGSHLGGTEAWPCDFNLRGKQWWAGWNDPACTEKMTLPKTAQQAQAAGSGSTEGTKTAQKGKKGKKDKKGKKK